MSSPFDDDDDDDYDSMSSPNPFDRRSRSTSGNNSTGASSSSAATTPQAQFEAFIPASSATANQGSSSSDESDDGINAWRRKAPYRVNSVSMRRSVSDAAVPAVRFSRSTGRRGSFATASQGSSPSSSDDDGPHMKTAGSFSYNYQEGTVDDAVSSFLSRSSSAATSATATSSGFSGRAPVVKLNKVDAQASERGLMPSEDSEDVPRSGVQYYHRTLQRYAKKLLVGTHQGDMKSAPTSIVAPRLLFLFVMAIAVYMPTIYDSVNRPPAWSYSPNRSLKNRDCIMNLYIEKFKANEMDYDLFIPKKPKNGKTFTKAELAFQPPIEIVNGTYRTKHQVKVVKRFIESVASSYRSNLTIQQHLLFCNVRDSGHMAEKALQHWPPRGKRVTHLHVVAADPGEHDDMGLGYANLDAIEERFKSHNLPDQVHLYDRIGMAGLIADDDEADFEMEVIDEDFGRDPSQFNTTGHLWEGTKNETKEEAHRRRRLASKKHKLPYPDLTTFFPPDEDNTVIPYMQVDGDYMEDQLEILESARPLLESHLIGALVVEHSIDMDVRALINWLDSVNYKTFFLGARQIHRLDHLCPEMLDDILAHPYVNRHPPLPRIEQWLQSVTDLALMREEPSYPDPNKPKNRNPRFFAAMPRGRFQREEMTIQHMYDLFGGLDGGGGQIKTANDRKVPGK